MSKKLSGIIKGISKDMSKESKVRLPEASVNSQIIQKFKHHSKMKLKELTKVTVENRAFQDKFNLVWGRMQKVGWIDRGFIARAAIIGGIAGIVLGAGGGAGNVNFGSGIGVPFILVTVVSGAFVGMMIKGLKREDHL